MTRHQNTWIVYCLSIAFGLAGFIAGWMLESRHYVTKRYPGLRRILSEDPDAFALSLSFDESQSASRLHAVRVLVSQVSSYIQDPAICAELAEKVMRMESLEGSMISFQNPLPATPPKSVSYLISDSSIDESETMIITYDLNGRKISESPFAEVLE